MSRAEGDVDLRLLAALRHAPDADAAPPLPLDERIVAAAREAVAARAVASPAAPWWRAALDALLRPPAAAAFATVVLGTVIGVMWQGDVPPEALPWPPMAETVPAAAPQPPPATAATPETRSEQRSVATPQASPAVPLSSAPPSPATMPTAREPEGPRPFVDGPLSERSADVPRLTGAERKREQARQPAAEDPGVSRGGPPDAAVGAAAKPAQGQAPPRAADAATASPAAKKAAQPAGRSSTDNAAEGTPPPAPPAPAAAPPVPVGPRATDVVPADPVAAVAPARVAPQVARGAPPAAAAVAPASPRAEQPAARDSARAAELATRSAARADAAGASAEGRGLRLPEPGDPALAAPVGEVDRLARGLWQPADAALAPPGGAVLRDLQGRVLGRLVIDGDGVWWLRPAPASALRAPLEPDQARELKLRLAPGGVSPAPR